MADGVQLPGVKKPLPKWAVYGGIAAVGVLVIEYYRKKSSPAAPSAGSAAATGSYPPDGTTGNPSDPYSTDPATGMTYGDESGGYGSYTGGAAGGGGAAGSGGGAAGPYVTPGGPPFASNSAWADWALQELAAQNPAFDIGAATDALGVYLAGQPLDPAAKQYVFDAEAIAGQPPVAGPGGYPPALHLNGNKGGGGGGGGGGGTGGGTPPGVPTGLHATARYTQADLSWSPVHGATSYRVRVWDHGAHIVSDTRQAGTRLTLHHLPGKTKIGWHVQALNASGGGHWSPNAHFTTQ